MVPAEESLADNAICGLIEFQPAEARQVLRARVGSDDTLHDTLLSLAQDLLDSAPVEDDGWVSESVIYADVESLSAQLLLIYGRLERRRRAS